ncbi:hypothetical protein KP509_24G046700 [Ceratopteris richardii]|uniref:DUF4283 domain-containing protein n=1 Tax=Ceratopteris richardii TaxID=49495 RepID=A0A8T2RUP8_CERRI|nr:hypothetical protein KP509_24G046700 [Ceratopteris richardii]
MQQNKPPSPPPLPPRSYVDTTCSRGFTKVPLIEGNLLQGMSPKSSTDLKGKEKLLDSAHFIDTEALGCDKDKDALIIDRDSLNNWHSQLCEKVVIGLCHGSRPTQEALKAWIKTKCENRGWIVKHVQFCPSNFILFFFEDASIAFQVISEG